jgi:hypothetical protein
MKLSRICLSQRNFDTFRFVQKLEMEGLSKEASEACMASLDEVVNEVLIGRDGFTKTSVPKQEYENIVYAQRVDLDKIRSEMRLLEKNEFTLIKSENSRLARDLEKLRIHMAEELRRTQSDVKLELTLEKVLCLSKMKSRIRDEQSAQELKIREIDSKVDTEISQVNTSIETIQWEIFRTLFPILTAAGALLFSYLRYVG